MSRMSTTNTAVPLRTTAHRYWPFDEVTARRDDEVTVLRDGTAAAGVLTFSAPWIDACVEIEDADAARAGRVVDRLAHGTLGAGDLADVSWLFAGVGQYPLSYILPRPAIAAGADRHAVIDRVPLERDPRGLQLALSAPSSAAERIAERARGADWKWDADAALDFSATTGGHDPITLFTLARRFHLLESVESNRTDRLLEAVRALPVGSPERRRAAALIVRQNHHVTRRCKPALSPAVAIAGAAAPLVEDFIRAEAGHDVLLSRALAALEVSADDVEVLDATAALMELFEALAARNFLAFAMVVDIFERSSYRDQDPLASLLGEAGFDRAARMIDAHREINDAGGHENVGLGFVEAMGAVDADYAVEALRLAERVTDVLHLISADLIERLGLACAAETPA